LDCTYCFFLSKDLLYGETVGWMDNAGLETYLGNLLESEPDGAVEIAWQGGEPTLRGLAFFERSVDLVEQLRRPGQAVSYTLQTNGTLLDDRWGEFFAAHGFLVGLSLDGPADLNDTYRVNKVGRGTHDQVVRGWQVLQRHGVDTNLLCAVHRANETAALRVYRYFRDDLGARFLQFIPIVERVASNDLALAERGWRPGNHGPRSLLYRQHGDAVTSRSVSPKGYGVFLSALFDEWFSRDIGQVYVQDFEIALANWLGRPSLCVHSPTCGTALAVTHTGDVYSCDHYVEPGYLLGNVQSASLQEMVTSEQQRKFGDEKLATLPDQCLVCPVRWACHGGCPKDRFVVTTAGQRRLNYLCPGYLSFFSHIQPAIEELARRLLREPLIGGVETSAE